MSAAVLDLSAPFCGCADSNGIFHLHGVPAGEYEMHVWVEGKEQSLLDRLTRKVRVSSEGINLGEIRLEVPPQATGEHLNNLGKPYHADDRPVH